MVGIYKITSPTGKIYIGQSQDINVRWKYSYKNYSCSDQTKLYNSLKKYGYENHRFEVLEECNKNDLDKLEILYKKFYLNKLKGWEKVLYLNLYDKGGGPKSKEHRRKISEGNKGRKHSKETKIKMSEKAKGRRYSEESKKKMSLAKKGKKFTNEQKKNFKGKRCKPILQYDLEGNFIKEWENFKQITDKYGFKNSGLCYCCKGVQKTAYGYIWKYKK